MAKLTPKQERFVQEYLIDLNATAAYKRAGYKARGNAAETNASRLLRKAQVKAAIEAARAKRSERVEITQDWVLKRLVRNVRRSMQSEPVTDREGNVTGEYTYEGAVANRALELIGRHLGMFKDKVEVSGPDAGPVEFSLPARLAALQRLAARVAPESLGAGGIGQPPTDGPILAESRPVTP